MECRFWYNVARIVTIAGLTVGSGGCAVPVNTSPTGENKSPKSTEIVSGNFGPVIYTEETIANLPDGTTKDTIMKRMQSVESLAVQIPGYLPSSVEMMVFNGPNGPFEYDFANIQKNGQKKTVVVEYADKNKAEDVGGANLLAEKQSDGSTVIYFYQGQNPVPFMRFMPNGSGSVYDTTGVEYPVTNQESTNMLSTLFGVNDVQAEELPTSTVAPTETNTPNPTQAPVETKVPVEHELEQVGNFVFYKDELLGGDITINPDTANERYDAFLSALWNVQVLGHNKSTLAVYGIRDEASFKTVCASGKKITGLMFPTLDPTISKIDMFAKLVKSNEAVNCSKVMVSVIHRTDMPDVETAIKNNWIFVESEWRTGGVMHLAPYQLPDGTIVFRLDISSYAKSFGSSLGWPIDPDPQEMATTDRITKGMTADDVNLYASDAIFNTILYSLRNTTADQVGMTNKGIYIIGIGGIYDPNLEASLMWKNQLFQKR